jgi:predicted CXXCH cytochrome family protein
MKLRKLLHNGNMRLVFVLILSIHMVSSLTIANIQQAQAESSPKLELETAEQTFTSQPEDEDASLPEDSLQEEEDFSDQPLIQLETNKPTEDTEATKATISITSPENGAVLNTSQVDIIGSITSFESSAQVQVDLFDGEKLIATVNPSDDGTWKSSLIMINGPYTIHAIARDSEGIMATTEPIAFTVDAPLPMLEVITPLLDDYTNTPIFEGTSSPGCLINICPECTMETDGTITGTWESETVDENGKWQFEDEDLQEGESLVFIKAIDLAGNESETIYLKFTYDKTRPIVSPGVLPKHDMTHVPLNTTLSFKISDDLKIDDTTVTSQVLTLSQNSTTVRVELKEFNTGNGIITFMPEKPLEPGKKYFVYVHPLINDIAGNVNRPRFWSFTTTGDQVLLEENPLGENPHGSYQSNVNTCKNCHSTHVSENGKLLSDSPTGIDSASYCNACHDGTVGAPIPVNATASHTHNYGISIDGSQTNNSCASCHNPHIEWSENNPNLLQDHFTHEHSPGAISKNDNQEIPNSSKEQLCESCHETDNLAKMTDKRVDYRVFQYNKWNTSSGILEDYELCLRCHNANFQVKHQETPDIAQYYNNLTEETKAEYEATEESSFKEREISPAEKAFSGHIIKAEDGSPLAGHIPCAECHDTHGSNNIKQLKDKLGHENPRDFAAPSGEWDPVKERAFCLSCHNGETAIYGVTGNVPDPALSTGHTDTTKSCASCHGGDSKSFLEAAHAPKRK